MKSNDKDQVLDTPRSSFTRVRPATYKRCRARLNRVKAAIVSEFRDRLGLREHLLDLAVNEAEALAWQTGFPQLVFPTLAVEKAEAAARWHARQLALQPRDSHLATAA
jgi:hypothetical protein